MYYSFGVDRYSNTGGVGLLIGQGCPLGNPACEKHSIFNPIGVGLEQTKNRPTSLWKLADLYITLLRILLLFRQRLDVTQLGFGNRLFEFFAGNEADVDLLHFVGRHFFFRG